MNEVNIDGSMTLYGSPQFNTLNLTAFGFTDEQVLELDAKYRAKLTKVNSARLSAEGYDDVTVVFSGEEPFVEGFAKTEVIKNDDGSAYAFAIFADVEELDIDMP